MGDTPEADVEGARAAGIRPVLIARDGADGADVRFAGRAHTLGAPLMTSPETEFAPPRTEVPVWVPFLALAAVLFIVSIFGLAVYAIVTATDPSIKTTDDLPVVATQALTFLQDADLRLRGLDRGPALDRRDAARALRARAAAAAC